jgi:hypothetical protein
VSVPFDEVPVGFAVVGVQKAATSTLHSVLSRHPEIAPTAKKELHFFDDEKRDWSRPDYAGYSGRRTSSEQRAAFDATPVYLFWPEALVRMRAYSPEMRLIASFRDPVERAFSQWMMQRERTSRTPDFDALVSRSLDAGDPRVPPDEWRTSRSRTRSVVARGFYGHQLARGLTLYPRSQWLLLDFVDVVGDQAGVCSRITDFMGLRPFASLPPPEQRRKSAQLEDVDPRTPSPAVLERLAAAYAPDLDEFEGLSGLTTAHWPTRRLNSGDLDSVEWAERFRRKVRAL